MDTRFFARIAAIALAAVAITLGLLQMREPPPPPPDPATIAEYVPPVDPLRGELRRCQTLGAEAATDRDCMRAWAENRRRFLGGSAGPVERRDAPEEAEPAGSGADPPEDNKPDHSSGVTQPVPADRAAD